MAGTPVRVLNSEEEFLRRILNEVIRISQEFSTPTVVDAADTTYTPTTPGDWAIAPANVAEALDEAGGRLTSLETLLAAGIQLKGGYDATGNTPDLVTPAPGAVLTGYLYFVTTAGTFFGGQLEVGDTLISTVDDPAALTDWLVVERNALILQFPDFATFSAYNNFIANQFVYIVDSDGTPGHWLLYYVESTVDGTWGNTTFQVVVNYDTYTSSHAQNTDTGTSSTSFTINSGGNKGQIKTTSLTAAHAYELPDDDGTLALTSDIANNLVYFTTVAAAVAYTNFKANSLVIINDPALVPYSLSYVISTVDGTFANSVFKTISNTQIKYFTTGAALLAFTQYIPGSLVILNEPGNPYGMYYVVSTTDGTYANTVFLLLVDEDVLTNPVAPITKSGAKAFGDFAGTPLKVTVTFNTPFDDANYSVSITGVDSRAWSIESVAAGSFVINANSNTALTGNVYWTAIAHGEN